MKEYSRDVAITNVKTTLWPSIQGMMGTTAPSLPCFPCSRSRAQSILRFPTHSTIKLCRTHRISCLREFQDQQQVRKAESENKQTGWKMLATVVLANSWLLQTENQALAELTKFSDDEWGRIGLTSGGLFFLYILVGPLVVFNYLRLRWYKRNAAETFFQFFLVFFFFPGMLLLAPFLNFRRLPTDPSRPPWERFKEKAKLDESLDA